MVRVVRMGSAVIAASLLLVLDVGAPASAAERADRLDRLGRLDRLAIGDSVMLGARWALQDHGFAVDAVKSRQATTGPGLLKSRGDRLARDIVIHLGTNGTFPSSTCDAIVRAAGPTRHVYLLTLKVPRRWERSNNEVIRACARRHGASRVTVIDWRALAVAHPGWLYADGIHLRPSGARAFTRLIDEVVDSTVRARTMGPAGH